MSSQAGIALAQQTMAATGQPFLYTAAGAQLLMQQQHGAQQMMLARHPSFQVASFQVFQLFSVKFTANYQWFGTMFKQLVALLVVTFF